MKPEVLAKAKKMAKEESLNIRLAILRKIREKTERDFKLYPDRRVKT